MKKLSPTQIAAFLIAVLVALAAYRALREWEVSTLSTSHNSSPSIGEIQSVQGDVEVRQPRTLSAETVKGSVNLASQAVVTTHEASEAVLILNGSAQQPTPVGAIVKLGENTRFVAEIDPVHPGGIVGTILAGKVIMVNPGLHGLLRLFREGRELAIVDLGKDLVPILPSGSNRVETANTTESSDPVGGIVITPTRAEESTLPTPPPIDAAAAGEPTEPGTDTLTNEDIVRQMRSQMGFFQRCYLGYLHRKEAGQKAAPTGGTLLMSFTIQSSGHVTDAKVEKTELTDATLEACVGEVINRTLFRGFHGNPVPVQEFPITLR